MAAPEHECRRVRALAAVTVPVPGFGMVVMDPDSKREDLRFPLVPLDAIDELAQIGRIADDFEPQADEAPAKPAGGRKAKAPAKPAGEAEASDDEAPAA